MSPDEATVAELLRTSSPEGLRRYRDELFFGTPAYDHGDRRDPRSFVVPCASPRCWRRVLVRGYVGESRRRYCSNLCVQAAYHDRDPERRRAQVRAATARLARRTA